MPTAIAKGRPTRLATRQEEGKRMRSERRHSPGAAAIALVAGLGLAGCMGETLNRGYVPSEIGAAAGAGRRAARAGADRARHALHHRRFRRRGVLLHLAEDQPPGRLHELPRRRPDGARHLFRPEQPGRRRSPITACRTARSSTSSSRTTPTGGKDFSFLVAALRGDRRRLMPAALGASSRARMARRGTPLR